MGRAMCRPDEEKIEKRLEQKQEEYAQEEGNTAISH